MHRLLTEGMGSTEVRNPRNSVTIKKGLTGSINPSVEDTAA